MKEIVAHSNSAGAVAENFQEFGTPKEILVPMDFSSASLNALQTAVRVARQHRSRITLLHVIDVKLCTYRAETITVGREMEEQARRKLTAIMQTIADEAICTAKIVRGRPDREILKAAHAEKDTMIIMGKRLLGCWRFLHRNTVERVLERADCEVIAVMEENKRVFRDLRVGFERAKQG